MNDRSWALGVELSNAPVLFDQYQPSAKRVESVMLRTFTTLPGPTGAVGE
jgi:hypothetical protein